ncbi:hypothetical protein CMV30_16525 [Nibricoccus aquaticus]|uniref:LamG-like jellyroll fold domain-containing protein n=1 Tax=Nibricoccus aquaticus TaxID=2576891 RepID=A0A290Q9U2_9BACT|nr:LamG domain-containing protein [Nibricoccus aquaticus]ATC65419.1 hypothetical protein CMV30_16525 [Nibricoccus aquaticus]
MNTTEPLCRWHFQEPTGTPRVSEGWHRYELVEREGPITRVEDGICGRFSMELREGQWLNLPRAGCAGLNLHGPQPFSVVAWVKRAPKSFKQCQAVAGMWNETGETRQYCLFLDLTIWDSADSVCGHVSATGKPSPGYEYCMEAGIGAKPVALGEWHQVAFTFDGNWVRVYLDGRLDYRPGLSPYFWPRTINEVGERGSDFTVGAVYRWGEMGNFFVGRLGGLAVYDTALDEEAMRRLHASRSC